MYCLSEQIIIESVPFFIKQGKIFTLVRFFLDLVLFCIKIFLLKYFWKSQNHIYFHAKGCTESNPNKKCNKIPADKAKIY